MSEAKEKLDCSLEISVDEQNLYWLVRYCTAPDWETTWVVSRTDSNGLLIAIETATKLWDEEVERELNDNG